MNDRELLWLAAKAAGEDVEWHESGSYFYRRSCNWPAEKGFFNPLHDDGEALRLAANLCISIEWFTGQGFVQASRFGIGEIIGWTDESFRSGAARRAVVSAAALIAKQEVRHE